MRKEKDLAKIVLVLILAILILALIAKPNYAEDTKVMSNEQEELISVQYRSHVQNIGWQGYVKDGKLSGTEGKSLRLEAIQIKLDNAPENVKIKYQTHIQNIGWQEWKEDGNLSGTEGKSLRLEALKIELENTEEYSVMYRVHVQNIGWQEWKIDGEIAGTEGKSLRLEAIEIKIVERVKRAKLNVETGVNKTEYYTNDEKTINISGWRMANFSNNEIEVYIDNQQLEKDKISYTQRKDVISKILGYGTEKENPTPGFNFKVDLTQLDEGTHTIKIRVVTPEKTTIEEKTYTFKIDNQIHILYESQIQNIGWQASKKDGQLSGTEGKSLRLNALKIQLVNAPKGAQVKYRAFINNTGWQSWKNGGEIAGTSDKNLKLEAIEIKLEGLDQYSVEYRAHVQDIGWTDWHVDGEVVGAIGQNKRIEAIEIRIVEKKQSTEFTVKYISHVSDYGWLAYQKQGEISGTLGENKEMQAINIAGQNVPEGVSIQYKTHIQDIGWENTWKKSGEMSGTTGQSKQLEAIKIKLEGTDEYSIIYRTYIRGNGWQSWAADGETSGTIGAGKPIEAIEIRIVPKIGDRIWMELDTNIGAKIGRVKTTISGWLMTNIDNAKLQVTVNGQILETTIKRTARADVLQIIKGYGGEEKNPLPGYEFTLDFTNSNYEKKNIKIQCIDKNGKVLAEKEINTEVALTMEYTSGVYGKTGLLVAGVGGSEMKYLKYGDGDNVFFATFAIHGYEDLWAKDGQELVDIANQFYNRLLKDRDYELAKKWTIYIFPGINLDGLTKGYTNNGPGRTTFYSQAPNHQGIDLNRCWQVGSTYERYTTERNYNGTAGFQAYEAQALRDFMLENKSKNGQTIVVDLHGWTQQLIGDTGICSYYEKQFPENDKSGVGRYGTGYMVNWARTYLGSSTSAAKAALIELPNKGVTGHQSVVDKNFANRYITATLDMLKSII